MSYSGPNHESRSKLLIAIATAIVAVCLILPVASVDLSSYSRFASFAAKGIIVSGELMFCLFLYSSLGRLVRKVVGGLSLVLALLLFITMSAGVIAWLFEGMLFGDIFGGYAPVAIVGSFAASTYVAWAFCFSPAVRAYEQRSVN